MNRLKAILFILIFTVSSILSKPPEIYKKAYDEYKIKNYDKSIELFNHFIDKNSKSIYLGNSYFWLGMISKRKKNLEEAEIFFLKTVNSSNKWKYADAYIQLDMIYNSRNDSEKSIKVLKEILNLRKEDKNLVSDEKLERVKKRLEKLEGSKKHNYDASKKGLDDIDKLSKKDDDKSINKLSLKGLSGKKSNKLAGVEEEKEKKEKLLNKNNNVNKDNSLSRGVKILKEEDSNEIKNDSNSEKVINNVKSSSKEERTIFSNKEAPIYNNFSILKRKYKNLKGYLKIKILVTKNGSVSRVKVLKSVWSKNIGKSFEKYIKKIISKWKFTVDEIKDKEEYIREFKFK
ncbi:MAG: hypothetical protein CR982_06270 [Candidatus Cloacimonadota bacterium]|nr:MAG: hypothetical protein CR982_06270 [Candidatus Cloacimonadota bacterium]PIE78462.1 MAG: hypothetical protein CSA15_07640 [Candidatus Delongbacteria bacterium]